MSSIAKNASPSLAEIQKNFETVKKTKIKNWAQSRPLDLFRAALLRKIVVRKIVVMLSLGLETLLESQ